MISGKLQAVFGVLAGAIVLTAIVWGFAILGSPFTERLRKFDDRRVEDLREIRDAIERMVVKNEDGKATLMRPLPATLEEVTDFLETEENYRQVRIDDPQTGAKYGYKVTGKSKFELCATFSLAQRGTSDMFWNHPAGRHCFKFDVLPEEKSTSD